MAAFEVKSVPEIGKDLKKIKVEGFGEDFELFLKALPVMVGERQYFRHHHIFPISGLGKHEGEVFIAKKIRCKSLRSTDRFRAVFQIIGMKILVIEVYFKNQKEIEDKGRIMKYCRGT